MRHSKRTNILIPLGGAGKRFSDVGYTKPKPFIDVNGESMIKRVIMNLYHVEAHFIFIINEENTSPQEFSEHIGDLDISYSLYSIPKLTEGPACTSLVAKDKIDNEDPLIIINCDQIISDFKLETLWSFCSVNNCDGLLGCFVSSSEKNSYVSLDQNGHVQDVKEKVVISNIATNGLHFWKRGSDFVKYAEEMIEKDIRVNNEFYVCPVFNQAVNDGKKIRTFDIPKMWGLGTPEDLNYYLENYKTDRD